MNRLTLLVPLVVAAGVVLLAGPGDGGPAASRSATVDADASAVSPGRGAQEDERDEALVDPALVAEGRQLYITGCSSCHGRDGEGVVTDEGEVRGPSLESSGEASAFYWVSTGRMPLASSDDTAVRKEPAYDPRGVEALVAYVGTLGEGIPVPRVDPSTDLRAEGGVRYRTNCQACHSATGAGGALSYGENAPVLGRATPTQIGAAMRVGPGQMPRFGREAISDEELNAIASYVEYLEAPDDRGGVSLGRLGPIPEGFLIWVLGIGGLLVLCVLIGKRLLHEPEVEP